MSGYFQYCPVAKSAELLCEKWTLLVLRELMMGSQHFNEIRRGLPKASPTIISRRLKTLEDAGVVRRRQKLNQSTWEYSLTKAGEDLKPIVEMFGYWGRRWIKSHLGKDDLDVGLLMWDMRRRIQLSKLPKRRTVICFEFNDLKGLDKYWWLVAEDDLDLCLEDPGYDVDLFLSTTLEVMTKVWVGNLSVQHAIRLGEIKTQGSGTLIRTMPAWLGRSVFANAHVN